MDDDVRITGPSRAYWKPLLALLIIGGGGFALYKYMIEDARSGRERGNPNMIVAPPRLEDTVPMAGAESKPPPPKALLRLESNPPGARVIVNGNALSGVTPTAIQTYADHQATVQFLLEGRRPVEKRLQVTGTEATLTADLPAEAPALGTLDITSTPDQAEVFLNGQPVGLSPLKLEKVPAGMVHSIRLKRVNFYDHTALIEVEADKEARAFVRLSPAVGERTIASVRVETSPTGAAVATLEDGVEKPRGKTTLQDAVTLNAPMQRPLHLRATFEKHTPAAADLDVVDPNYTVFMRLVPPEVHYARLSFTGTKGLTVYVGPEEVGNVPVKDVKVRAGSVAVVILDEASGARAEATLTLEKDQSLSRKVTLVGNQIRIE